MKYDPGKLYRSLRNTSMKACPQLWKSSPSNYTYKNDIQDEDKDFEPSSSGDDFHHSTEGQFDMAGLFYKK